MSNKPTHKKPSGYTVVLSEITDLLEAARRGAARSVNTIMTATYWEIGRRVVEFEQKGEQRAEYGKALMRRLSEDLSKRFGRGFSITNLEYMRLFYQSWKTAGETALTSDHAVTYQKSQTASGISSIFPLPWSHYVRLLSVKNPDARAFYEREALAGGWTIRKLNRQIGSQFFERSALSKNKAAMLKKGEKTLPADAVTPEAEVKDPLVLEFLDLKDEYSESDIEEALIRKLEDFLLELGGDFTFVARQKRLRIGDQWFRVDLVFYHRKLRCLIIIDLKLDKFTYADVGQMNVYINFAKKHWTHEDENPPVGLILCATKDEALAEYALEGLSNKVLAAEYKTALPDPTIIAKKLRETRKLLESRATIDNLKKHS